MVIVFGIVAYSRFVQRITGLRWLTAYIAICMCSSMNAAQSSGQVEGAAKASIHTVFLIVMENHNWTGKPA